MNSSLLTIITTIAEIGALGGLLWQLMLSRRETKARFMIEVYNDHEDKLNRTLDDGKRLKSYADKRGIGSIEARKRILATIDINDAFKNYMIYRGRLVSGDLGEKFLIDVQGALSRPENEERWRQTKHQYPKDFQNFIESATKEN